MLRINCNRKITKQNVTYITTNFKHQIIENLILILIAEIFSVMEDATKKLKRENLKGKMLDPPSQCLLCDKMAVFIERKNLQYNTDLQILR